MNRHKFICLLFGYLSLTLGRVSCKLPTVKSVVLIVSPTRYRNAFAEILQLYKQQQPNVTLIVNFGGSGFLRRQIEQRVPADILISEIEEEIDRLQSRGDIIPETRKYLMSPELVLIIKSQVSIAKFEDLTNP